MTHLAVYLLLAFPLFVFSDRSQDDCNENEIFLNCGRCEASCWEPEINCAPACKPPRCECVADLGYVRAQHGHCVHLSQCPGPNIYSMDPSKGGTVNSFGDSRKKRELGLRITRQVQVRPYRPIFSILGTGLGPAEEVTEYLSGNGIQGHASGRRFLFNK